MPDLVTTKELDAKTPGIKPAPEPQPKLSGQILGTVDSILQESRNVLEQAQATQNQTNATQLTGPLDQSDTVSAARETNEGLLNRIARQFQRVARRGEEQVDAERAAGIPELSKDVNNINNQILQTRRRFENEMRNTQDAAGLTSAQRNARINQLGRDQAREEADLAIIQQVRQNNLTTAQALVDRRIDLEFEAEEQQLEGLKFFFDENKETLTAAEERQYQLLLSDRERELNDQKETARLKSQRTFDLVAQAAQNGAPTSAIALAQSAKDEFEAQRILAPFLQDQTEQLRRQLLREQIRSQQLENAGGPDTGRTGTQSQFAAAGFASRIQQAGAIIEELDQKFTGNNPINILGQEFGFLPQTLQSEDRKRLDQAQRNFINALLRRESGAAIGADEFANAAKQYLPQPGDTEAVLEQKSLNRKLVEQNLINEAGTAFDPSLAQEFGLKKNLSVNFGGADVPIGSFVTNSKGEVGVINPDGSITLQ